MAHLEDQYYDIAHPGSYAGADKLYRSQDTSTRKEVKNWLKAQEVYTLHKPVRRRFRRNQVVVSGIDGQWDADLIDYSNLRSYNNGYSYVLVVIDILSRFVWCRKLKTKKTAEVAAAMEDILNEGRSSDALRTDRGAEFLGVQFRRLMEKKGITHFLTNNELKASYAERVIKTLKKKIARYFTHKQTRRWENIIDDVTKSYNSTYHRSIRRSPASVNKDNATEVLQLMYGGPPPMPDGPFKIEEGAIVRISYLRRPFMREYDETWTEELFKVRDREVRGGLNVYEISDLAKEDVSGKFYESELQEVTADLEGVFKISKVLRSRKRKGHAKEYLVVWKGYPESMASWVKAKDMQDI